MSAPRAGIGPVLAALLLAACTPAPMPAPAAGEAPPQDAMAPSDVAVRDAGLPSALPPPELAPPEPVANDLGSAAADAWVGRWGGAEGTYLQILKQEVGYQLIVANLDGPREFHAVAVADGLQFERDGVTETLRAGDGKATGMKWLADRRDCLVVKPGEGFCR